MDNFSEGELLSGGTVWIYFAAVIVLLLISAIYSAAETAMTAVSRARMAMLEKEGHPGAALVNKLREDKDRFIGAMLLGNNLMNILASSLATSVLMSLFGAAGIAYATAGMTVLVLIFAEVLPKSWALQHADTLAMRLAPFVQIMVTLLSPIVDIVSKTVRVVLRLIGVVPREQSLDEQVEELRGAIELHQAEEEEVATQRAMLRSILDLSEVTVEEVMTHRNNMILLNADAPMEEIIHTMFDAPHSRYPVYRGNIENIIGLVHVKSFMQVWHKNLAAEKLSLDALVTAPWFVPSTTTLHDQLQEFRTRAEHIAIVVDEYAAVMGLITLEDILEEIVGDIVDETDRPVLDVRAQSDGSFIVAGTTTIRDLNREFEWDLPDEEYSTLAGLIIHEAKIIPNIGQMFTFYGFRFKILKRERHQITQVRIYPPVKEA